MWRTPLSLPLHLLALAAMLPLSETPPAEVDEQLGGGLDEGDGGGGGGAPEPSFLDVIKEGAAAIAERTEAKLQERFDGEQEIEEDEAAAAQRARAAHQPKDEKGRFAKQDADEGEGAPPATDDDPAEAPAADPNAGPTAAADGEGFVVKLPARMADQPDIEITVSDKATAERINQLRNMAMRGSEVAAARADLAEREADVEQFTEGLACDPIGYVADHVPPEYHEDLVRYLLTTKPELFKRVIAEASKWEADPRELELATEKAKNARDAIERKATTARSTARAVVEARTSVINALDSLVPDDLDQEKAALFRADAVRDIQAYLRKNPDRLIDGEAAIRILETNGRLAMYGLKRPEGQPAGAPPARGRGAAKPAAAAAGPKKPDLTKARADQERMKSRATARQSAAATAPSGAGGAPVSTAKPPAGLGVKETIAWARKKFAR